MLWGVAETTCVLVQHKHVQSTRVDMFMVKKIWTKTETKCVLVCRTLG